MDETLDRPWRGSAAEPSEATAVTQAQTSAVSLPQNNEQPRSPDPTSRVSCAMLPGPSSQGLTEDP